MPSGYTLDMPDRVLLDVGVVYYEKTSDGNATKFGVSVGGLTLRREVEYRDVEFDGGNRAPIEGLSRKTRHTAIIAGTFLLEVPKHIPLTEPGVTSAVLGGVTTWTPKPASTLLAPDTDYLQNVRLVGTKPDGTGFVDVLFTRSYIRAWNWVQEDNNEQKMADVEIISVLKDDTAAVSTDTAPYVYREYATLASVS